jgi:hypothetical protein
MYGNPRLLIVAMNSSQRERNEPNTFNQTFGFVDNHIMSRTQKTTRIKVKNGL